MDVGQFLFGLTLMRTLAGAVYDYTQGRQMVRYRDPIEYQAFNFSLNSMSDTNCIAYFRFTRSQIAELLAHFCLGEVSYRLRNTPSPELAVCIVLYRLSHPNRYKDNFWILGRSMAYQSAVFTDVIEHLTLRYRRLMDWDDSRLTQPFLTSLARTVEEYSGGRVRGVFGWVDGTQRPVCRPGEHQQDLYSGYQN